MSEPCFCHLFRSDKNHNPRKGTETNNLTHYYGGDTL